ncbi:MAG: hypothetical protein PF487_07500, partial [Bacteroidales bacterium]|nr:hypothetical protein [Bacteroidales bacterium]
MVNNLNNLKEADYKKAIEIKPGIFWVGSNIIDDDFQCHPYLLVNGKNSVLFDPGSVLTFLETFSKIESIIPFSHIRYFVCHHQDPDITGALNIIDSFISREDAVILSHWRAIAILKHLGLRIPLQCVEEMGWSLDIGNNMNLKFIFSPYLHFPGAFVTYLESQKALFSSDIFGAISPEFNLIAQDEKCYEGIRLFHEHYMPSHEILLNFLNKLENIELDVILPQHGSIIPRRLIPFIINKLKVLECGVYTLTQTSTELKKLSRLNKLISDITKIIILSSDFKQIINVFLEKADLILNIEDLFFVSQDDDGEIRILGKDNIKTEKNVSYCKACRDLYGKSKKEWLQEHGKLSIEADSIIENETDKSENAKNILLIPLFNFDNDILIG